MSRKLKLFNGRLAGFEHGYIAAYSRADAVRIYEEFFGGRGVLPEIRDYWSEGLWGNQMIGVTPRRGMFAETKAGALVEFVGFHKHKPLERDNPEAWEIHQAEQQTKRNAAEAEKQRAREEKRERLASLYRKLMMLCDGITLETDRITFVVEGDEHRYEIREIE